MSNDEKQEYFKKFIQALNVGAKSEVLPDFLIDFFSETELDSFIKRLEVLKRLHRGHSYSNLNKEMNVSPITASKAAKQLRDSGKKFSELLTSLTEGEEPLDSPKIVVEKNIEDKRSKYIS